MAYNGAGTFNLYTPGNPVVTGTTISSSWANSTLSDIATGLSTAICKDGQTTITGNIPMASFKLTGLAAGTASTDSARFDQIQAGIQLNTASYLTSVSGTNTITATATPTPTYTVGQKFTFIPAVTNTGAVTLDISSVGAGAVQWAGAALTGGELVAGTPITVLVTAATPVFEIINATQFPDTRALVVGGTDATKKVRFEVDGLTTATTRVMTVPDRDLTIGTLPPLTNSLSGDVALNNTVIYFTGPTVAQGTSGTWLAIGTVTVNDTAGAANINVKLWDGTTVIASAEVNLSAANQFRAISLSGYITSPAGNIRISVQDASSTSGVILYNSSGNSKDSTLSVIRIG